MAGKTTCAINLGLIETVYYKGVYQKHATWLYIPQLTMHLSQISVSVHLSTGITHFFLSIGFCQSLSILFCSSIHLSPCHYSCLYLSLLLIQLCQSDSVSLPLHWIHLIGWYLSVCLVSLLICYSLNKYFVILANDRTKTFLFKSTYGATRVAPLFVVKSRV